MQQGPQFTGLGADRRPAAPTRKAMTLYGFGPELRDAIEMAEFKISAWLSAQTGVAVVAYGTQSIPDFPRDEWHHVITVTYDEYA